MLHAAQEEVEIKIEDSCHHADDRSVALDMNG
jgi:hypothetical protein